MREGSPEGDGQLRKEICEAERWKKSNSKEIQESPYKTPSRSADLN